MDQVLEQGAARRGRGRPSRAAVQAIDRQILDAAWQCFIEQPFEDVSMEQVAQAAGITKATLYARHVGRNALVEAVVLDRLSRWSEESSKRRRLRGETLEERLRDYGLSLLAWSRNPEIVAIGRLLRGRDGVGDELGRKLHGVLRAPMIELIAADIEAFTAGRDRAVAPRMAATIFMGMLLGYPLVEAGGQGGPTGEAEVNEAGYVDGVVALFLNGIYGAGRASEKEATGGA